MNPAPSPPNPFSMGAVVRPAVILTAAAWALITHRTGAYIAIGLVAIVEAAYWTRRFSAVTGRPAPPVVVALGGLLAWIVDPVRVALGMFLGTWWLVGCPVWIVNRQRWDAAWARRAAMRAQRMAARGSTTGAVLAGAGVLERLRRPRAAALPIEDRSASDLALVTGVVRVAPDGSRTFEPLEAVR